MELRKNRCRYLLDNGTQCLNAKAKDSQFCEQHANWLLCDLEIFKVVTEHFRQDVREFWTRSNLYLAVQAGLLSVFAITHSSQSSFGKAVTASIAILGFLVAVTWFVVLRGALFWLRRWRDQTVEIDNIVDRHRVYAKVESFAETNPLLSPSNMTQLLPVLFSTVWIVLIVLLFWLT